MKKGHVLDKKRNPTVLKNKTRSVTWVTEKKSSVTSTKMFKVFPANINGCLDLNETLCYNSL